MNTAVDISVTEESPSPTADTAAALYNYECTPQKEEDSIRVVSDSTDQNAEGTAISEEEGVQDNKFA
ncbi:hypothetical protein MFLAVUS_010208 [Mucor flavus]|uniref:Uncharacterized protein n=1 Tax=Mucor flavus TaxID=439312 RepID=A0ABP9ZC23_9FUNG